MDLVLTQEGVSVTAVERLEGLLEHGTLAVSPEQVAPLLVAIRAAAHALTPLDAAIREADPARAALVAQALLAHARAARALAEQAPAGDENAAIVLASLERLQIDHNPAA